MASHVDVTLNGEPMTIAAGTRLSALVEQLGERLGRPAAAVAVERNGEIVPRGRWAETLLGAGDRLEIVQFVQGGARPAGEDDFRACLRGGSRC